MPKKLYPADVLRQAQDILSAWNEIGAASAFGSVTPATLSADIASATSLWTELDTLQAQLIDKRNQRDALYCAMWDKVKRIRAGVKANFGDDSSEYEMVGGTRRSERKLARRKATVTA